MMQVDVTTPEDYMGDVIGDINSRRGLVGDLGERGNAKTIRASVPLANVPVRVDAPLDLEGPRFLQHEAGVLRLRAAERREGAHGQVPAGRGGLDPFVRKYRFLK